MKAIQKSLRWLQSRLYKVSERIYYKSYYTSINDLPAYNWFELNERFDISMLSRNGARPNVVSRILIPIIWKKINHEYIDRFGMTEEFLLILDKKKSVAMRRLELIITGDMSLQTLIEVEELEIESLINIKGKFSYFEIKTLIEKYFNFHLDLKTISVAEFYTYLEVMKKQNGRNGNKA